ncbi:MAG: S-methyl-5-thioribose-1-phosphate isomerase [Synergistes sp.]|nr:S-methyl-5-thioribose-1-phosphate isomerase [Synergistes sp.]
MVPETLRWENGKLFLVDQGKLPFAVEYVMCATADDVVSAIKNMTVRGAPAIGVAAAYALVLAAAHSTDFNKAASALADSRPTAVNLMWSVRRMTLLYNSLADGNADEIYYSMEKEAIKIHREDIEINRKIGYYGASLLPHNAAVITHCNAGALATAGYGTALGVLRAAAEAGKNIKIYADETRPRLQGGQLTSYELCEDGFDVTVITDSMASFIMANNKIDAVITGADRVAANGDTANKIGTYGLAVAAKYHGVPFYVAAPLSTFDTEYETGRKIPIEERDGDEIRVVGGRRIIPEKIKVWNPSFDVTPHGLISGIITECGIIREPYEKNICELFK